MAGRIAVVDAQNRFLRWEERATIHRERLPHRSVHIVVFDDKNRLLIQKRKWSKQTYPSHWDLSCAGHVEESDYIAGPDDELERVYYEVALRELEEELGLTLEAPLTCIGEFSPQEGVHYEHFRLYATTHEGPFTLQEEEVEEIQCVTPAFYDALLQGQIEPMTRSLRFIVSWLRLRGLWS